ncbi:DegT/DnrJ/EryC1/StrS family aminotransferase [Weeksellaceae bacterium KMM 9713]|uniref:DegT/DnrJ/EryC1/StrS family aminotransferase n=2 Tax=Profundicola chukchiensis TaxID=2961959 RepID=A0A9X4N1Q7_9FLAO|nr:DegT/DnrJ/EryC1/StrS family aminotransferase [Profundicola chukchiensis]MDG4944784.1 DegT/DnrJ/EryC1/StrS family aminotransferase [Profundicola chukchiensis]
MINVTKSFIPSMEEFTSYLQPAFTQHWLTNRGDLTIQLENKLKSYLQVSNITLTANGTLPIQIAIKALKLKGEIITTPFSFVATTTTILWENCTPVFVDIEEDYLTIDPKKIEQAITDKTSAILATHIFGNPCDIDAIQEIADKYNLKVIYDGAHAFGVKYKGKSIFEYGDVSTCSFHATKLMHTGEGGAFFSKDFYLQKSMYFHHNFGHNGPYNFNGIGINAKMSELHAAMGLAVFDHLESIISKRKSAVALYIEKLNKSTLSLLKIRPETQWNYHYFPILFPSEKDLLIAVKKLKNNYIYPRRYFYPSLNTLPYLNYQKMEISEDISSRILCLPLSSEISEQEINQICNLII